MAWTDNKFSLRIKSVDSSLNYSNRIFKMTAVDYATAITDALIIIGLYEAVTEMATIAYHVQQEFENDSLTVPTDPQVQREVVAVIVAEDDTEALKRHIVNIIGAQPDVFGAPGTQAAQTVDFTNSDVTAYVNMFSTGGECLISDGEILKDDGWLSGKRTTRRNSNG